MDYCHPTTRLMASRLQISVRDYHLALRAKGQAQLPTWPRPEKETPNYPPQRQTLESYVRRQFPETETKSL
jgi:hypothetical protein